MSDVKSEINLSSDVTVSLENAMISDQMVANAARVSTVGEDVLRRFCATDEKIPFQNPETERNRGLINFLMRDRHGSPFEHNSMTFFIKAPIFVAREFMRHRVGWSYNEESGRYRELQPNFYIPGSDRHLVQVGKPGAYTFEPGTKVQRSLTEATMAAAYEVAWDAYQRLLRDGVAREVARMVLPVGIFTTFYATCNARSLMHFLSLRTTSEEATVPSFPQREIEMVAEKMEELWADRMPLTHTAFEKNGRVAP